MADKSDKFQLLEVAPVNFSLTEGTDIPPPESPVDEAQPPSRGGPLSSHPGVPQLGALPTETTTDGAEPASNGIEKTRTDENGLKSPTKSISPSTLKRPGSIRRFLGLTTLSASDAHTNSNGKDRPMSPQSVRTHLSTATDGDRSLTRKKSIGWFGKRKSTVFVAKVDEPAGAAPTATEKLVPKGPPPPSIPELGTLDGGDMHADDLFKSIK